MLTARTALRCIADLALPRVCVICGRALNLSEDTICICCQADLPLTHFWELERNPMADKFNNIIARRSGSEGRERYCYAAALIFYKKESEYKNIPQSLKYHGNLRSGRYFSTMLGEKISSAEWFRDVDAVVPVPLHWTRKWKRGYNQAEIIARGISSQLKGAEYMDILVRKRATSTQTRLGNIQKESNVRGAFAVTRRPISRQPRHILLVDDVLTSGSTSSECYNALRDRFGYEVRISVATLAFAAD